MDRIFPKKSQPYIYILISYIYIYVYRIPPWRAGKPWWNTALAMAATTSQVIFGVREPSSGINLGGKVLWSLGDWDKSWTNPGGKVTIRTDFLYKIVEWMKTLMGFKVSTLTFNGSGLLGTSKKRKHDTPNTCLGCPIFQPSQFWDT